MLSAAIPTGCKDGKQNMQPNPAVRALDIFLRKLLSHSLLSTDDQAGIAALPHSSRHYDANDYILREGDHSDKRACPARASSLRDTLPPARHTRQRA